MKRRPLADHPYKIEIASSLVLFLLMLLALLPW
jgi:hypothetical protein